VASAFVGDVADIVRIDTLRSAPLIFDRITWASPPLPKPTHRVCLLLPLVSAESTGLGHRMFHRRHYGPRQPRFCDRHLSYRTLHRFDSMSPHCVTSRRGFRSFRIHV